MLVDQDAAWFPGQDLTQQGDAIQPLTRQMRKGELLVAGCKLSRV